MPNVWEDLRRRLLARANVHWYHSSFDSKNRRFNLHYSWFRFRFRKFIFGFSFRTMGKSIINIKFQWVAVSQYQLRSLSDARVLSFSIYYVGWWRMPIEELINAVTSSAVEKQYKRTFCWKWKSCLQKIILPNRITNNRKWEHRLFRFVLDTFRLSNCDPYRMWSDGRWNKLTMAHGCYWEMVYFFGLH
jgi:hypothetical protein